MVKVRLALWANTTIEPSWYLYEGLFPIYFCQTFALSIQVLTFCPLLFWPITISHTFDFLILVFLHFCLDHLRHNIYRRSGGGWQGRQRGWLEEIPRSPHTLLYARRTLILYVTHTLLCARHTLLYVTCNMTVYSVMCITLNYTHYPNVKLKSTLNIPSQ